MVQLRSRVFVTFMLALLSGLVAVQCLDEDFECPPPMNDPCTCNYEGPTTNMLKVCLKVSHMLCKLCGIKYQTYLNCSECSAPQPPVCGDQEFVSHEDSRLRKGYLIFCSPPTRRPVGYPHLYLIFSLNTLYKMRNTSYSPFCVFKMDNYENSLKPLSDFEIRREEEIDRILISDFIKKRKELKMKTISNILDRFREKQKIDEMLYKLCDAGLLSQKPKICKKNRFNVVNGINSTLSNLRYRREVDRTENDDIFGMTDKDAKMPEGKSTTRLRQRYERKFLKEDTVTDERIITHFRTTRKSPAGEKHPPHVRGKKHRKFSKNRNPQAKFKSVHLEKGSHPNKALLDKQTTSGGSRFDEESGSSSYRESGKVNATYITPKNDVPLSDISKDVLATSSFFRAIRPTEAPWVPNNLYNKQYSKQASWNSSAHGVAQLDLRKGTFLQEKNEIHKDEDTTEHDLSYQIHGRQPTEPEWDLKSLSNAENSKNESFLTSNVFRSLPRLNDTYSSGFPTSDMSSNESTKYRESIKTAKIHDHASINTSSLTTSQSLEEVKETVYTTENFESDGVKRTDNFINRPPHATDEKLVQTNSSKTSKGKNVANEIGMPNHYESEFLVISSDQSDSNYITGQHLFNNASSGRLIETAETVKPNSTETVNDLKHMPLIDIFGEKEQLTHLMPSVQDKNGNIRKTNSKKHHQIVSTTSSSLRKQDSSPNATEYKDPSSKINGDIIAGNGGPNSDNVSDISLRLSNQQGEIINSPTSRHNENRDTKSGNSGNLTYLPSHISFTGYESKEYSTDSVTSEYKLVENQTFGASRKIETFAVVASNLPNQQKQNSHSKTFVKSGSIRDNEINFRHANFIYSSTDKNDTNQTFLGETAEHTIDKSKTKEANQDQTIDEKLGNIQSHTENNKFDGMNGNIRISESTETGNRDNLYGNFSNNENKALSFSYETGTKSGERNRTVGYKPNYIFDHYTKMLQHFNTSDLNATGSKESISDHVEKLNFRMFKNSEIQKNSSGHFIDDGNTHGSFYYRTTKYDNNDYKSSTTLKDDNTTVNQNQTTIKNSGNVDNDIIESLNLESEHSYFRYKRNQPVVKKVNEVVHYNRKNLNDSFQNKAVLLNFTEDFLIPPKVIKQNSVDYNKEKDFHIPKKSEGVLDFALNSSEDPAWFYNGTTKNVEKANKGILKNKNIGMNYKSKKAQSMSLYKDVDEFFAMSPNSNKDQKESPKSIKVKQTSDSYSKDTGNKGLDIYWTSSGYERNHQFSNLSGKSPESTKHNLQVIFRPLFVSDNRQEPFLKEISEDTSLQIASENANDARKKYISPKFRTGKKLLQFSVTDNNKLVGSRDIISLSLRKRRSLKNLPENDWCKLPKGIYYGKLDCTIWSYQKVCVMTCTKDNKASDQTEYKCARKKNVWEPKFQSCENDASRMDYMDLKEFDEDEEYADNKQFDKSRDITLPTYEYITGDEEYDMYVYKFE